MTRVLLVEDDPFDRRLFEHHLSRAGLDWDLMHACDLHEAVELLAKGPFDLVITDLMLPDGEGQQIIDGLLAAGARRVVLLSGRDAGARKGLTGAAAAIDKNHFQSEHLLRLMPGT